MKILRKSAETMDAKTLYKLATSPEIKKMTDASELINVGDWVLFEDTKIDNETGEVIKTNKILSIMDAETGVAFATNSPTFVESFETIVEIFGNNGYNIRVDHAKSNKGRTFIQAVYAD